MLQNILQPVLSSFNKHERDNNIKFYEIGHKYFITTDPNSKYTSVTTWNHSHFPKFDADAIIKTMMSSASWKEGHKYWGMTAEEIKKLWTNNGTAVSGAGTDMHYDIECFMNNPKLQKGYNQGDILNYWLENPVKLDKNPEKEWLYFLKFAEDFKNLKPYRTEWMIYHEELKLAGSIDMVYENEDGTLSIYDWKRSKEITKTNNFNKYAITACISNLPDTNFWHYSLQLNTYKAIIEEKYGKKVTQLFLVRLHPDIEEETYDLINVPFLTKEINELFELRKNEIMNDNEKFKKNTQKFKPSNSTINIESNTFHSFFKNTYKKKN